MSWGNLVLQKAVMRSYFVNRTHMTLNFTVNKLVCTKMFEVHEHPKLKSQVAVGISYLLQLSTHK